MFSPKKNSKSCEGTCSSSRFPYYVVDVCRDYGDLMEEAATAPGAAETNGVADHEDTEMSQPDTNGAALSDQQVRGHAKRSNTGPCLLTATTRNHNNPRCNRQVLRLSRHQMLPGPLNVPCLRLFSEQVCTLLFDNRCFRPGKH
jgi:hypothetical protein